MRVKNRSDQSLRNTRNKHPVAHGLSVFLSFAILYVLFFSPVLFSGRLLAPGDGITLFLPAFYAAKTLWTSLIFAGYPIAADPQNLSWYPPALILGLFPNSWNAFVVLAYVLAGSFAYAYSYTVTHSKLAATVTGLTYSMSGFMLSHLGHPIIIHAAAWIPLIVCAFEKLRHRLEPWWLVVGALAVACCVLGGHPQVSAYGLGAGLFYALFLGWSAPVGRWKFYRWAFGSMAVGLAVCAVQVLPTIELSQNSLRATLSLADFLSFSLPAWQALQLIFPYFFGGAIPPYADLPQWGKWGLTETTGYVGLLPLMLGVIGAIAYPKRSITWFWFWFGLITLLAAFGGDLLMGYLLYYVPVYNKFRAQGRHFVEVALAVSVLAGFGVASIQQRYASRRLILRTMAAACVVMLICLASLSVLHGVFLAKAKAAGISSLSLFPWANPGVGIPLLIFAAGVLALGFWSRWLTTRWSQLLLILVIVLDLSSFGWFYDWQLVAPTASQLQPNAVAKRYRDRLQASHQRFLNVAGNQTSEPNGLFPNLTRLWNLPNAGGYSPLMLTRVSHMMRMAANGALFHTPTSATETQLDLMGVRYMRAPAPGLVEQKGVAWADGELLALGSGICASPATKSSASLSLPTSPFEATAIGIVSTMSCSVGIPDNAQLLQVRVTDARGNVEAHRLLAGRDTAEHAHDCPDVKPVIKHQRAQVFRSRTLSRPGMGACKAHEYVSTIRLSRPQTVSSLSLDWGNLPAILHVKHISLINEPMGTSLPLAPLALSTKWKQVEQLDGGTMYENQQALPRTWLVPEAMALKPEEVLTAIHTSQLPDARMFVPRAMALVEDGAASFKSSRLQAADTSTLLKAEETQVDLQTHTTAASFLILSDVYYPGWKASIDGKPTPIFPTNYIQRGVKVPAGDHLIRFEYDPLSFKLGVGLTTATFFGCAYWLFRQSKRPT